MRLAAASLLTLVVVGVAPARAHAAGGSAASLDTVLTRHVHDGRVDYAALARDRGPLTRFLAAAAETRPDDWPRAERFAFWVNVYNARVLDGVVRRPGLRNVLDVGRVAGVSTHRFFLERARSGGRNLSLHEIENEILRKRFADPRVHFVLNCASASCPILPAHPLDARTLEPTLDAAARAFLADTTRNPVVSGRALVLSQIFEWYRSDFEAAAGSLPAFLRRYAPAGATIPDDASVRFRPYDWSLAGHW